jgi:hypothetical protein
MGPVIDTMASHRTPEIIAFLRKKAFDYCFS